MADWRHLMVILGIVLCGSGVAVPVAAYGNYYAHPTINELAIQYFEKNLKTNDPYLKGTTFSGQTAYGLDWSNRQGDPVRLLPSDGIVSVSRQKSIRDWIIDGGFSMDEPEYWQSLRHFYDPKNPTTPWLTDHESWLPKLGAVKVSLSQDYLRNIADVLDYAKNPQITAVQWAFDRSTGYEYSYPYAKMYLTKALASDDRNNQYYGKAWRAVGETMHMLSDMTVPAHVRNDAHGLEIPAVPGVSDEGSTITLDIDPYERSISGGTIRIYANYPPVAHNYNQNPESLMKAMALYTNEHFIAQDTNDRYTLPVLSVAPASDGYIHGSIDGTDYRVAKKVSFWGEVLDIRALPNGLSNNPALDSNILEDQKKHLIPTAIRGSAAVLDRFLPRFQVTGDIQTSQEVQGGKPVTIYYLDGQIVQKGNAEEWPEKLTIRNGAEIVNSKTKKMVVIPVDRTKGDNLNQFRYQFSPSDVGAKAGDKIYLAYDLGGYVIRSADMEVPEEYPTPTVTEKSAVTTKTTSSVRTVLTTKPTTIPTTVAKKGTDDTVYDTTYCSASDQKRIKEGDSVVCRYTIGNYRGSLEYIAEAEKVTTNYISSGQRDRDVAGLVYWRNKYKGCGCCKYFTAADASTFKMVDHYNQFTPYLCG